MRWYVLLVMMLFMVGAVEASRYNSDPIVSTYMTNGSTFHVTGDYSASADVFKFQPEPGVVAIISRLIVGIEDGSGIDVGKYGNGITLTNGIVVQYVKDGVTTNVTEDPIIVNGDWGRYCYDIELKAWGTGNDMAVVRWTFSKAGTYIKLDGNTNDSIQILVNDDLTGLVDHTYLVQGYYEESNSTLENLYTANTTEADGMTALAITIFMLSVIGVLLTAPFTIKRFHEHWFTDTVIRRSLIIVGIYMCVLFSAMMATMSIAGNIGLDKEFTQTFIPLFGWLGYGLMLWTFYQTVLDLIKTYKDKRGEERGF